MYCIKCGTENDARAKYCYKCGTLLPTDLEIGKAAAPYRRAPTLWQCIVQWSLQRKVVAIAGLLAVVLILVVGIRALISVEETSLPRFPTTPQTTWAVESSQMALRSEAAESFMTEEEFGKLATLASYFTNPHTREVITGELKIAQLFTTPSDYDGKTVAATGKVLKKTLVLSVLPSGWPTSYYLIIDDGTASLPVLYRGNAKAIGVGDTVRVTGLFSKASEGINADAIQKADTLTSLASQPFLLILAYSLATVLVLILLPLSIRVLWRRHRQAKTKVPKVERMT
ncbi:MAG: zinc ribbon domain-containing protein [Dehalococcoidia bacterium]|nr:zinc ribbon domain-containing protein [Dehalococcoidia bacterium]